MADEVKTERLDPKDFAELLVRRMLEVRDILEVSQVQYAGVEQDEQWSWFTLLRVKVRPKWHHGFRQLQDSMHGDVKAVETVAAVAKSRDAVAEKEARQILGVVKATLLLITQALEQVAGPEAAATCSQIYQSLRKIVDVQGGSNVGR